MKNDRFRRIRSKVKEATHGTLPAGEILAGKLFGRMTDALAAAGDEGRGKPR